MPQFGAYLILVIYDDKDFTVPATGPKAIKHFYHNLQIFVIS